MQMNLLQVVNIYRIEIFMITTISDCPEQPEQQDS